ASSSLSAKSSQLFVPDGVSRRCLRWFVLDVVISRLAKNCHRSKIGQSCHRFGFPADLPSRPSGRDCGMRIASPDFGLDRRCRAYSAVRRRGLLGTPISSWATALPCRLPHLTDVLAVAASAKPIAGTLVVAGTAESHAVDGVRIARDTEFLHTAAQQR